MHRRGGLVLQPASVAQLDKSANFVVTTSSPISRAACNRSTKQHMRSGHIGPSSGRVFTAPVCGLGPREKTYATSANPVRHISAYPAAKMFRGEFFQCFGRFRRSIWASTDQAALAGRLVYIQLAGRFPQVVPVSL